jgi:hypothetical protein
MYGYRWLQMVTEDTCIQAYSDFESLPWYGMAWYGIMVWYGGMVERVERPGDIFNRSVCLQGIMGK